nr:hypothetical protein CFP56_68554 [Quercus suber]
MGIVGKVEVLGRMRKILLWAQINPLQPKTKNGKELAHLQNSRTEIEEELRYQKRKSDTIGGSEGRKKQRLDIETTALRKLMAQHLGSAGFAKQPRRVQRVS